MPEYFFVLGRDPKLAVAELVSYLEARNISHKIAVARENVAIVNAHDLNLSKVVTELGGTVKAGLVVARIPLNTSDPSSILDKYPFWTGSGNKLNWTVSALDENKEMEKIIKEYFKQRFKSEKLKAMWKNEPRPWELSKWKSGIEMISFFDGENVCIGKTFAVFDPRETQKRDLERPVKKIEIAISLRIARILINLSGAKPGKVLLDPFCGIGTILQEALLSGIEAKGIDIEPESVEASKKNLAWFSEKYGTKTGWNVDIGNATELPEIFERGSIDTIATEPYLGPLLKSKPSESESKRIAAELLPLYRDFLTAAYAVLAKGGRVAAIFPTFGKTKLPIAEIAKNIGFEILQTDTFPYLYTSEQKKLDRLIFVLVKN